MTARALPHCSGTCNAGRAPCNCTTGRVYLSDLHRITCTELDCDHSPLTVVRSVPTPKVREIPKRIPPPEERLKLTSRGMRLTLLTGAGAMAALAFLIACFQHGVHL